MSKHVKRGRYCTYTTYTGRQKRMNSTQYRNTMKHVKPITVTIIVEIGWSPRCSQPDVPDATSTASQ